MADDKESYEEEEYQYADVDLAKETELPPTEETLHKRPKKRFFATLMSRRIIIPIVIVIAIFVVYQFIGRMGQQQQTSTQFPTTQAATTDRTTDRTTGTTTQAHAVSEELSDLLVKSDLAAGRQMNKIKQQQAQNAANIQQLQINIQSVDSSLIRMQRDLASASAGLSSITQQLQQKAAPATKMPRKVVRKRVIPPRAAYQLKAVVPGRAWLQGSKGSTQTIKVGDTLQGYGRITAINTVQGQVVTSSGRTISYGERDS